MSEQKVKESKKQNQKVKLHKFEQPIYPYQLYIISEYNSDIILNNLIVEEGKNEFKELILNLSNENSYARTISNVIDLYTNEFGVLICFRSKSYMTIKTIAHESVHAARFFFNHIGADLNDSVETLEYLVGWIAECCEKVRNYKNFKKS